MTRPTSGTVIVGTIRVFVSYAREDSSWLDEKNPHQLVPFLADSLKRHGVKFWFDGRLQTGEEYKQDIDAEIDQSQIALLLLSQWFLNSKFIAEREVPRIFRRVAQGQMVVIPLLVEPCDWTDHPYLADRKVIPGEPLIDYTQSSAKFARIRSEILEGLKANVLRLHDEQRFAGLQPETDVGSFPLPTEKHDLSAHAPQVMSVENLETYLAEADLASSDPMDAASWKRVQQQAVQDHQTALHRAREAAARREKAGADRALSAETETHYGMTQHKEDAKAEEGSQPPEQGVAVAVREPAKTGIPPLEVGIKPSRWKVWPIVVLFLLLILWVIVVATGRKPEPIPTPAPAAAKETAGH